MSQNTLKTSVNPGLQPRLDQNAFNLTSSQAATTAYTPSMADTSIATDDSRQKTTLEASNTHGDGLDADDSDGNSRASRYTFRSDVDREQFVKRIGGRVYNTLNDTYFLPSDDDEWIRLNKQHVALVLSLGNLYPAGEEVRALLAPSLSQRKRILDLGCGTGVWVTDMALKFPHAEVVGVDLSPVPVDPSNLPPNCRFEIDDINLGLDHFKESFDLVHMRLVGAGLRDFRKTMDDGQQCLKPGGIVIYMDGDYDMYAKDYHVYVPFAVEEDEGNPEQTERSWFQRIVYEMRRGAVDTGKSDLHRMAKALDEGLWEDDTMDPETCRTSSLYLPIGPWVTGNSVMQTQQLGYVGALIRQDLMSVHRAGHAVMKRLGWDPIKLDRWSELADKQLMSMNPKMWLRMHYAWGRRRAAENQPAPLIPLILPPTAAEAESIPQYPHYNVYTTQEESLSEAALRNHGKNWMPPPLPKRVPTAAVSAPTQREFKQGSASTST